jgi:hypothetical protein
VKYSLSFLFISIILLTCISGLKAQSTPVKEKVYLTDEDWNKLPTHPRLFANDACIVSLKLQSDEITKKLLAYIKNDAEKKLLAEKTAIQLVN